MVWQCQVDAHLKAVLNEPPGTTHSPTVERLMAAPVCPIAFPSMTTIAMAGAAGRITGRGIRGLLWMNQQIDWVEVGAIVLHGLQVLIVLLLLAGHWSRRAWDALPVLSEQLGRWYSRQIVRPVVPPVVPPLPAPVHVHPLAELGHQLEALTCRELRSLAGTRRKLAKRQLVALLVAAA